MLLLRTWYYIDYLTLWPLLKIKHFRTTNMLTSKSNSNKSIGMVYLRAKFCMTPVRKACVKQNPETQNVFGLPSRYHFCKQRTLVLTLTVSRVYIINRTCKNFSLSIKSFMQDPSGLRLGQEFLDHNAGILPIKRELAMDSNSPDITTRPLMALIRF